jgi:hypothetical protein
MVGRRQDEGDRHPARDGDVRASSIRRIFLAQGIMIGGRGGLPSDWGWG